MRQKRRKVRPIYIRARFKVTLEIVCVQFYQPRQDIVSLTVNRARRDVSTLGDLRDHAAFNGNRPAHHLVAENQFCICEANITHLRGVARIRKISVIDGRIHG